MKVVINSCFGGFSLSDEAESLYAKKKGFEIFRYKQTAYKHSGGVNKYTKIKDGEGGMMSHTLKKDMGDECEELSFEDDVYWSSRDIERNDIALIEVVEELGVKASGQCASLEIIEIPDDANWEIAEYDGNEHVAEKHKTWG